MKVRNRTCKNRALRLAAGLVAAAALVMPSAGLAHATRPSDLASDTTTINRVIDRTGEKMPWPAAARSGAELGRLSMRAEVSRPAGLTVAIGQSVQVNYADGVVVHQALSDSCDVTASAGYPTKTNNHAHAAHSYGLSWGVTATPSLGPSS